MSNFYDQMPTQEQFENFKIWFEEENEQMRKNADYRMQNYFNCVDDYSWGGLCDKAASEAYGKRLDLYNNLATQMRDGAFVKDCNFPVLVDMDGNIVSDKIVNGRFGNCWIINEKDGVKFVGLAKKQSTYAKKGYKVMTRVYTFEYYYLTNGKVVHRLLDDQLVESTFDQQPNYSKLDLYMSLNNN